MSASGSGRSAVSRIVPFETEKPSSSVRTIDRCGGEREDGEVMGASAHADQRLTGDLECRHGVADAVDGLWGYAACDVDDALQRVVLGLREVSEGIIDGFHGLMLP